MILSTEFFFFIFYLPGCGEFGHLSLKPEQFNERKSNSCLGRSWQVLQQFRVVQWRRNCVFFSKKYYLACAQQLHFPRAENSPLLSGPEGGGWVFPLSLTLTPTLWVGGWGWVCVSWNYHHSSVLDFSSQEQSLRGKKEFLWPYRHMGHIK